MKTTMVNFVRTALLLAAVLEVKSAPGNSRIVGGVSVNIVDYPYQVSLQYYGSHFCGGSIISKDMILTAGHCVFTTSVSGMTVRVGSSTWNSGGTVYNVTSMTRQPKYTSTPSTQYDMALFKVSPAIVFKTGVQAIALPVANTTVPGGTEVIVSGWGMVNATNKTLPTQLQAVRVNIVDLATCKTKWNPLPITETMICAGGRSTGGIGACMGDSGGPLIRNTLGSNVLYGVVSFGNPCGVANYPDVFARVANLELRAWIKTTSGV